MQRGRIVVVGSLNMDLSLRVPTLPRPGETLLGRDLRISPGGKGANQAVAAARLGGSVIFIGCRGPDAFGDQLASALLAEGIDTRFLKTGSEPTGTALILLDDAGQNQIAVAPGANWQLGPEDLDRAEPALEQAAVVLAQAEVPLPTVVRAAVIAARYDVPFIFNPAPAVPLPPALLAATRLLVPNETELADLFAGADLAARIAAAHAAGVGELLVTLGARGARYSRAGGESWRLPAFPVEPVDSTAAGDAFVAGLAVALVEGRPLLEAARFAAAAGALAVTRPGAQTSLPTREEVERLLQSMPLDAAGDPAAESRG